jgi:hypothetical protein
MPFAAGKVDPVEAGKKGAEARWGAPSEAADQDDKEVGAVAEAPLDTVAEMERVLRTEGRQDSTPYRKRLRKLLDEDIAGFHRLLEREKEHKAKALEKDDDAGPDEGADNARAVLERVLKELSEEAKR